MDVSLKSPGMICEHETGSKLVDGLMERQEEVLIQLDQLNASIESMIRELTAQRSRDVAEEADMSVDRSLESKRNERIAA